MSFDFCYLTLALTRIKFFFFIKDPNQDQQQHSVTCKHTGGGVGDFPFTLCPLKTPRDAESKKKEMEVRSSLCVKFVFAWFFPLSKSPLRP